jgi:hypothetical protein
MAFADCSRLIGIKEAYTNVSSMLSVELCAFNEYEKLNKSAQKRMRNLLNPNSYGVFGMPKKALY